MMSNKNHWLTTTSLTASVVFGLVLGACGGDGEILPPGELVRSSLDRDLAPDVSAEQQSALIAGNTQFALDAYHEFGKQSGNVFYSPLSISTALAMTYGGARGNTESQMADALHYDLPQAELHKAFNWLDLELDSRGQSDGGKGFQLSIANATFGQIGYAFLPEYLDLLGVDYDAGM